VVDLMVEHCELGKHSLFIDVGSGLGKPNIHVAQVA
jgi:16S rRNA G527 N7-methylase RsmG